MKGITEMSVSSQAKVTLDKYHPETARPLIDFAAQLALYVKPSGGDKVKFIFSKYTIDAISHQAVTVSPLLGLMQTACSFPVGTISAGNSLLMLCAEKLWQYCLLFKTVGEIPGFDASNIASFTIDKTVGGKFVIKYVPSFSTSVAPGTHTQIKVGGVLQPHNFNPCDWDAWVKSVGTNIIGIPIDDNSAGSDLIMTIGSQSVPDAIIGLAMFAFKNKQNRGVTGWDEIIDEIQKGLVAAANVPGHKLLVIISTRITEDVKDAMKGKNQLVLESGSWCLSEVRCCFFIFMHSKNQNPPHIVDSSPDSLFHRVSSRSTVNGRSSTSLQK